MSKATALMIQGFIDFAFQHAIGCAQVAEQSSVTPQTTSCKSPSGPDLNERISQSFLWQQVARIDRWLRCGDSVRN
jgi:hypothetical protein